MRFRFFPFCRKTVIYPLLTYIGEDGKHGFQLGNTYAVCLVIVPLRNIYEVTVKNNDNIHCIKYPTQKLFNLEWKFLSEEN